MPREAATARVLTRIEEVAAADWDCCANPEPARHDPFVSHAFLAALEASGCVGERTGWAPCHLLVDDGKGGVAACMPTYLKSHSKGEYVFDYGWADAYERAGGSYYPKLLTAVPFTPVAGRRLLVAPGPSAERRESLLVAAALQLARQSGCSGWHVNFASEGEWQRLGAMGLLQRTDQQFHWHNTGYSAFDDFLASLASRKRKAIRKERAEAVGNGLTIRQFTGGDLTEAHWDAFFAFYMDTGSRKWGRPYLNRRFFSLLGEAMADRCLLVMVERDGRFIAGALNMIGGDCLYGRYWGAIEHHPCLHFEVCYYQAIEYAIGHGLARVEAGAQGEHKLARGYLPRPTHSAHWIENESFRKAVADYLDDERAYMERHREALTEQGPFRRGGPVAAEPGPDARLRSLAEEQD